MKQEMSKTSYLIIQKVYLITQLTFLTVRFKYSYSIKAALTFKTETLKIAVICFEFKIGHAHPKHIKEV